MSSPMFPMPRIIKGKDDHQETSGRFTPEQLNRAVCHVLLFGATGLAEDILQSPELAAELAAVRRDPERALPRRESLYATLTHIMYHGEKDRDRMEAADRIHTILGPANKNASLQELAAMPARRTG